MSVLVTGGTGHLGANLVRRLLDDGHAVRVLVQPRTDTAALDGLKVQTVTADLRDPYGLSVAVAGCERIYHCAAQISTRYGGEREIYESNVVGTRNLLTAARSAAVGRVVMTSSLSSIGHVPGRVATEDDPFYPFDRLHPYAYTKQLAEQECFRAVAEGQDVVMVVSTALIGPNDFMPSRLGGVLLRFARSELRAFPDGGFAFVAARDLVNGHLLAMERGRSGQRYIVSTEFQTIAGLLDLCDRLVGPIRRPVRIPTSVAAAAAALWDPIARRLMPGGPEHLTPVAVRLLGMRRRADHSKAVRELGFRPTGLAAAVAEAYECFARRGLVRRAG